MIKDYSGSLNTLVTPNVGELHPKFTEEEATERYLKKKLEADPSVFNFYVYLRTHPLIQRHNLTTKKLEKSSSLDKETQFEDTVTPLERKLYFSTAHFHLRAGCPALAVEVLTKLPNKVIEAKNEPKKVAETNKKVETGTFDQSETMDWGLPVAKKVEKEPKISEDLSLGNIHSLKWSKNGQIESKKALKWLKIRQKLINFF